MDKAKKEKIMQASTFDELLDVEKILWCWPLDYYMSGVRM